MKFTIILTLIILLVFIIYTNTNIQKNKNIKTIEKFGSTNTNNQEEVLSEDIPTPPIIYDDEAEVDTFSFDQLPKFTVYNSEGLNHILNICGDASGTIFNSVLVKKEFNIRGKDIKYYAANIMYPIGSFYTQYPDKNTNNMQEAFPDSSSPAYLFGGTWEEQWSTESLFFRSRGVGLPGVDENRKKGLQDYAIKRIKGIAQSAQTNRWGANPSTGSIITNFYGVCTDDKRSSDTGVFNRMDNSFQSLVSDNELRVRNRLCKVWKRILGPDDVFYDASGNIINTV
jgi:hypothetical protein